MDPVLSQEKEMELIFLIYTLLPMNTIQNLGYLMQLKNLNINAS